MEGIERSEAPFNAAPRVRSGAGSEGDFRTLLLSEEESLQAEDDQRFSTVESSAKSVNMNEGGTPPS